MTNTDATLVPEFLQNWQEYEVRYKPGEPDDDGKICLWFETDEGKKIPVAARSELMVVTGPQKSRKTLLTSCMLNSRHTQDRDLTLGFTLNMKDEYILLFDTEQPVRRTKKNMRKMHEFVGLSNPDPYLKVYNIKRLTSGQKMAYVTHIIKELQNHTGKNPGMVIIDQIADLAPSRDVNSETGVDMIYNHLNMWQSLTDDQTLFQVIIHTNRGRQNTNGKLGVMLDQKTDCTFHIDIDFDSWISTVRHKEARDRRIPKFTFRQDFTGEPRLVNVEPMFSNSY